MTGNRLAVSYEENAGLKLPTLQLGLFHDFGIEIPREVANVYYDDAIIIDVEAGSGTIAGTNPRACLIAVYRFLREIGCRWIRPGSDGEIVPSKRLADMTARVSEHASLRHRGIVIEGASSSENVADMIEWLPKLGFNSYFIQFKNAYPFFYQWYAHVHNPTLSPEPFTLDDAKSITRKLEQEIKKRGLLFHAVGHGWTCESLRIPALGRKEEDISIPPNMAHYLAETGGKREFWKGNPVNTNLCYSNDEARRVMVDHIAEYLEQNGDIDLLHVWLADDYNNHCECRSCAEHSPTDLYVKLLNELDQELTNREIQAKIVFLLYFELLWAPETNTIVNPDRFMLMFAPISRTFAKSFADMPVAGSVPEFVRNHIKLPQSVEQNVAFLRDWQRQFPGEGFDFDYPLGRAHYGDPGYMRISEVISSDIRSLGQLGLNGYLSCQEQRAFLPTALPNYVMGLKLWNSGLEFGTIADDYFQYAFGPDWSECKQYLSDLSSLFDIEYWCGQKEWRDKELAEKLGRVEPTVNRFKAVIERNREMDNAVWKKSWIYLDYHAEYAVLFAQTLMAKALEDEELAKRRWDVLVGYLQRNELALQPVFDVFRFIQIGEWKLKFRSTLL
jgi:hypothetical protein